MAAIILLLLLGAATAFPAVVQRGSLDPAFDTIPFDQWLADGDRAQIPWSARVYPARLSIHQRLSTQFEVRLDTAELARRHGRGKILILVQLDDEAGVSYRDHGTIDLDKPDEGWSAPKMSYTHSAFVLPGDYRVCLAIFDTATSEHSVKQEKLHVPPLKNDPLSEAWRNLPPVEFRPPGDSPDSWYLPSLKGRLHLPIETRHRARIDVIVNLTPEPGAVLPALRTISQVDLRNASLHVALLDLSRRRVTYQQDEARDLDWSGIRDALAQVEPGRIDVKSLEDRRHNARFFVTEVRRRLGLANPPQCHILIVLSNAVTFESRQDLPPVRFDTPPDCRVFYIRFHDETIRRGAAPQPGAKRLPGSIVPVVAGTGAPVDQLASTLKPLAPRLFDVTTPEQFRKALATMLTEIASL